MNLVMPEYLDIDLVTILMVYGMIYSGSVWPGIFAFFQGMIIDIFSVGIPGLFSLLYLVSYFAIRLSSRLFDLHFPNGQMILICGAVLMKGILLVIILHLFSFRMILTSFPFVSIFVSAIVTGLASPLFIRLFHRISHGKILDRQEAS